MELRSLGTSPLKVSKLCLGTMTFGASGRYATYGDIEQSEANEMVAMCMDAGINFFDTADIYSDGISERMLGQALAGKRSDVIIATKVMGATNNAPHDMGLSREHIMKACEASLQRLNTDYIDLYQVHSFDPEVPLEESLRALSDLVQQGKVRYIGCSNFAAWQLMKARSCSNKHQLKQFVSIQSLYSLCHRDIEDEIIPLCQDQGIGVLCWSPLAGGFLTGKYRKGVPRPTNARRKDRKKNFLPIDEDKGFKIINKLDQTANKHQTSIAQCALNYLLQKPGVSSVIIGARNKEQLTDNLKCVQWQLDSDDMKLLDRISTPPKRYPAWFQQIAFQRPSSVT